MHIIPKTITVKLIHIGFYSRDTTIHYIRGQLICASAFSAVIKLHPRTVADLGTDVTSEVARCIRKTNERKRHKEPILIQTDIFVSCLQKYSELISMECPSGRGSAEDFPITFLDRTITKWDVFLEYDTCWAYILIEITELKMSHGQSSAAFGEKIRFLRFVMHISQPFSLQSSTETSVTIVRNCKTSSEQRLILIRKRPF